MKTITKKYKVYKFNELGKKVRNRIIRSKFHSIIAKHYVNLQVSSENKIKIFENELKYINEYFSKYLYLKDGIVFDLKK